jgi:hypothetical protein
LAFLSIGSRPIKKPLPAIATPTTAKYEYL